MPALDRTAPIGGSGSWMKNLVGASSIISLGAMFNNPAMLRDSAKLFFFGSLIETGRRFFRWLFNRVRIRYSMKARFEEHDPAYEWIIHFLTKEKVWRQGMDFQVMSKTSQREWSINSMTKSIIHGSAEYIPTYSLPQLFRWNGYWLEVQTADSFGSSGSGRSMGMPMTSRNIVLTVFSVDMSVLSRLVEEARRGYDEANRPHVIVHSIDNMYQMRAMTRGHSGMWADVKRKSRRPVESIILPDGVLASILQDARDFINSESWYNKAGIPHRMGFLLYGPPGTGKTSTIYALAGELGFEIYSLSLSSQAVDDTFLQRAASAVPKHSIFLLEDIDCAFPPREDEEESQANFTPGYASVSPNRRSMVTLSGMLNVIDGVGSEEGRLFFATTNYMDRLDDALLRPGRIDRKIEYNLATSEQASSLFTRFFHVDMYPGLPLEDLAAEFGGKVPVNEFSTAELQGYLLGNKMDPKGSVEKIEAWVERERKLREEKAEREMQRKAKRLADKEKGISPPSKIPNLPMVMAM